MKTDQNSNMQGTLDKRISMKKRRNAKRALLALNLVAVIFTTTVFSNPVSVLSEEVSTDAVQNIENNAGGDAQIAEQADVQQNTAEAAPAAEVPAAEAPAAENSAEAAKAEEPSGVNSPAENTMSAEMSAAEDGAVSTDDGASSASAVQSADASSTSNGSFEDAGAGNTDETKDGIIENDAEGLNEAEGTAANEEAEDAASQEQLTYADEHVKISASYTDGRAFTADSILTGTYLDSDEKNAVLSAVNAQISKGNSADTVSDTAENTESSGSAPVASTTATTVEYSVAGFHALMLAAKNQDGSNTTTEGDVTFSAEFKKGLNDAGYASREETTENNEAGGDGSLTTTTTRCETSWKIYTVTEKNLTDITDITDAHNTHYEMDENGTLKSASFRGALPQTVAFVQIVKKTVTETTTQKETEKATERETESETDTETQKAKETEKIAGTETEQTTEKVTEKTTERETDDVKEHVSSSAAMPAVTFDQKVTTDNGTVMVHVEAEEGAFEEGTSMTVTPVTSKIILDKAIDAAGGKGAAAAMDITFTKPDGTKTEPLKPIHVKMISAVLNRADEAHVVHVADSGTIDVVARKSDGKTIESTSSEAASSDAKNAVSFESDSFSVYAIVYTVDFEYSVNGKMYQFSLPGGEKITLSDLVEVLGIIGDTNSGEKAAFNSVEDFLKEVANVQFSDESLVKVTPVEGDWVLESLAPFTSEEKLTITMKNGDQITIKVTDAQSKETNDLTRFLHAEDTDPAAVVLKINGQDVSDSASDPTLVHEGDQFSLTLNFREINGGVQFPSDDTWMEMPWPEALTGVSFNTGDTFDMNVGTDSHGQPIMVRGNKIKVENGKLMIQWNTADEHFADLKSSGVAYMEIKINGTIDSSKETITFTDQITKYIQDDPNNSVDLAKSGNYNKTTGNVDYTIRVSSNGTNENVTVQDVISNDDNKAALKLNNDIKYTVYNKDGTPVAGKENVSISKSNDYSFSQNIGTLTNGQYAVVTYSASVDTTKLTGNGTADQTTNTVTVGDQSTSTDMQNRIDWLTFKKEAGEVTGSGNTKIVNWTITANEDMRGSMAGKTITDTIGYNSRDIMHYVDGITVDVYNGNTKIGTRTLNWGDNNSNGSLVKTTNSNGQESWTYTVPAGDGNYKYVISYKTEVDVTGRIGNTNVSNNVNIDGRTQDIGKDVPPGTDKVNIDKTHGAVTETNTDWTVSFNVPANGLSDAYIEDWLPKKSNEMIDEYTAGSLTVTSNGTAIPAYTGNESGGNPQEYYVLTDSSSDLNSPHFRIDFYRWDATAGKYVLGLAPSATERTVVATFKTDTDSTWAKTYLPGSGGEYHTNTAVLHVGNQQIQDSDTIVPPYTGINKEGWREGTITVEGVEYPLYHYKVTLYGVTDWQNVTITDTHDSRLRYLDVIQPDGTALRGDASKIQVFYTGNYEKNAYDPEANIIYRPSFTDTGNTLTIKATAANQLPMNNTEYCTNYSVEYYMIPADIGAMQQASIASAKTDDKGITKMKNTAEWDTHMDDAEVTYQYDGVKKNYTTPYGNNRVLHFEVQLNPSARTIGTGDTLTMTDTYENLSVDYSSIVVTHLDGTPLTDAEKALTSWDYHGNEGTFIIPNGVALKVAYDARVVGNGTVTFRNKAVMEGFEDSNENTFTYTVEGSGGAENYKIRIYKYAAGHMETGLGNAKFRLLDANKQPILYPNDYEDTNLRGQEITFTTVAEEGTDKGYVTVMLDSSTIGYALAKDTVYYLEEINPPSGFEQDYIQYSFEISDHSDYDNKNGVYRYHNDDILKISNKPEEGGLILAKSISGINENKLTAEEKELINNITFEVTGIFQHVKTDAAGNPVLDEHGNEVYEQDASATTRAIKYSQFTDGRYRIDPKEIVVGQKYTVVEKNAGIEGYQLATTYKIDGGQVVEAFPDEDGVVFTDDDISAGKSHRVTITNRYTTHAYNFTKYEQGTISTAEPVLLEGAEFTVYKYNAETGKFEKTEKVYTTDEYGEFGIRWIDRGYEYDTAYYVVETKAPTGYEVMPDEYSEDYAEGPLREKYYFYFSKPDAADPSIPTGIPDGSTAVDLSITDPENVNVENAVLEETTTKIEVRKEWKELNASGQPGNDISAGRIAELHPEWVENGIPFYVYQVTRTDRAFTSADLKTIAQADITDPENRQGVLYTTEENPTGEYRITYDPGRTYKWQGLVLDDLPSSRTLFGKTTYYGYYIVDEADGFIAAYDYSGTKFENFTYEGQSNYLGHLELWNVQEPTELYVKKALVGPTQEISRVSDIQFQIYRDPHDGEEGDPDHNGWVLVPTNPATMSMKKDSDGEWGYWNDDGSLKAIAGLVKGETYHVVETKVAPDDLSLSVWDVEVSDDNVFHGGETAIITNTYKGKYLSVVKEWDIDGDLPSEVKIQVFRREKGSNDEFVKWKEESLNQGNNWTKYWKSGEMELNNKDWEYYVVELTTGYYTQISATEDNPLEVSGTITVKNSTKYDGEIEVNKVWKNKSNSDLETDKVPDEVILVLQRAVATRIGKSLTINVTLNNSGNETVITKTFYVPQTVTSVNWKVTANNTWAYEWSSWNVSGSDGTPTGQWDQEAGIIGTVDLSSDSTVISVSANHNGSGGISNISLVGDYGDVQLDIGEYSDVEGKEVTLTKPNWSYTWENLPTDAGNNQVYVYSVREVSVDGKTPAAAGFVSVVTGQDTNDGTVTVTNTETDQPKGSISVTKNVKVDEEDSAELNNQRITIGLFKSDTEPANDAEPTQTEMLTITGATTTQNSLFSNLDLGTYWVYELDSDNHPVKNGGTLAVNAKSYTVTEDSPNVTLDSENLEGSVEITNSRDETVSATVNIYKIKKDDEETKTPLKDATFTITKVRENLSTSTPTIDTSWTDAHAEADRTKITNGEGQTSFTGLEAGYYEIRETNTPKGYVITGDAQFYVKVEKTGIKLVKVEQVQEGGTTKYVWSDGTANSNVTFATASNTAQVENEPGAALPNTGGPGTRLFTILGSILILGAGVLLWRRRRTI